LDEDDDDDIINLSEPKR